ncbi:MAG: hypothetical protein Q4G60_13750 [bacterium]|nr:hypothetical protein [bacterium]
MMRDVEQTIGNLIAKRKTAYISSVDADGFPNTKAMLPARKMVGIKEECWRNGDTMYYSKGVTDPDYCILKFTATSGRYYANFKKENFTVE